VKLILLLLGLALGCTILGWLLLQPRIGPTLENLFFVVGGIVFLLIVFQGPIIRAERWWRHRNRPKL
jgi:hypothetical protein